MTASDPRVGEIQALAEGLTDLCPEHLRQSIRHVQRNCDIECNTHEDETTWDHCKQPDRYDGERMAKALAGIPYLLAELADRDAKLARVEAQCAATDELASIVMGDDLHAGLRMCARGIRAAVAAATGDGE